MSKYMSETASVAHTPAIPSDSGQRVVRITTQIGTSNYHFDTWYFRGTTHIEVSLTSNQEMELVKGNESEVMAWFLRNSSHAPDELVQIYRIIHDL